MTFKKRNSPWNKGKVGLQHHTEEFKKKMSERMKGKKYGLGHTPWNKGKKLPPLSAEHKKKQSESLKLAYKEGRAKVYPALYKGFFKGQKHTKEAKLKMRLAKLGIKRKPMSEETKRKMSLAHKGKIYTTDHKKKARARVYLNLAISRGKMKKGVCEICGNKKAEAHHEDYNYPLKVEWLCKKHHKSLRHKKNALE